MQQLWLQAEKRRVVPSDAKSGTAGGLGAGLVVFGRLIGMAAMKKLAWHELKAILPEGSLVAGVVLKHEPYGVFVDIGHGYDGIIQITDFNDHGVVTPNDYPPVGTRLLTRVLGFKDHGFQVWLGVKPSQMCESQNL